MMNWSKRILVGAAAAAVAVVGMVVPASAATGTITVNNGACFYDASANPDKVVADNINCNEVRAAVEYITAGGSRSWVYAPPSKTHSQADVPSGVSYFSGKTGATPYKNGPWYWQGI